MEQQLDVKYDPDTKMMYLVDKNDNIVARQHSVAQTFCREDMAPIVIVGQSNSGKTVLALDIWTKCLEETNQPYSDFIFITNNKQGGGNQYLREIVLNACIPDIQNNDDLGVLYQNLLNMLQDESGSVDVYQTYSQIFSKEEQQQIQTLYFQKFYENFKKQNNSDDICQICFRSNPQMQQIIYKIFNQQDFNSFIQKFDEYQYQLKQNIQEGKVYHKQQQIQIGEYFGKFLKNVQYAKKQQREDICNICRYKYHSKFKSQYQNNKNVLTNYYIQPDADKDFEQVMEVIQNKKKYCVIFDDVTEKINSMDSTKEYRQLQNEFLTAMFTKGRHKGTFVLSVHNLDTLGDSKKNAAVYVICQGMAQQFKNQRSAGDSQQRSMILSVAAKLEQINKQSGLHKYLLVFYTNTEFSPDENYLSIVEAQLYYQQGFNKQLYNNNPWLSYLAELQSPMQIDQSMTVQPPNNTSNIVPKNIQINQSSLIDQSNNNVLANILEKSQESYYEPEDESEYESSEDEQEDESD